MEQCWNNDYCIKPCKCDENCVMYVTLKACIKHSRLPENYKYDTKITKMKVDLDNYLRLNEIKTNIKEFVENGENLMIYSTGCGNGKTAWATKLLIAYILELDEPNCMDTKALFLNVVDLLMQVRMNREYGTDKSEVKSIIESIDKADLVIWDEIGVNKLTDYEMTFLYTLINKRIQNMQSNIYTSNTSLDVAEINLTQRLYSRIYSLSEKIEFMASDWRERMGK